MIAEPLARQNDGGPSMSIKPALCLVFCLALSLAAQAAERAGNTVIYDGKVSQVGSSPVQSADLWVTLKDLTRSTGFVLKPQGVCRDELCFPLPKARKQQFISKRGGNSWFNLSEFGRLLKQPVAYDEKNAVWYFGPRPDVQNSFLSSLEAPDFKLPDLNGKAHSLSDFRGKKVLLVTWASW
jgi:hypothetical protein